MARDMKKNGDATATASTPRAPRAPKGEGNSLSVRLTPELKTAIAGAGDRFERQTGIKPTRAQVMQLILAAGAKAVFLRGEDVTPSLEVRASE
jgi:hypothetical protein